MPKSDRVRSKVKSVRQDPLEAQLAKDEQRKFASEREHKQGKRKKHAQEALEEENEGVISSDMSRKILSFAREQLDEERELLKKEQKQKGTFRAMDQQDLEDDEDDLASDGDEEELEIEYHHTDQFAELRIDAHDERALEMFMGQSKQKQRTLADIIMEKIQEKERGSAAMQNAGERNVQVEEGVSINRQLIEVYRSIGQLLKRYRAGKIPKAFKIIPALQNWEEVLYYTDPEVWSPQAMRAATRIFASNLNQKMAQRFYALVLLPAVRDDIKRNKKLNYHLYMALKKALYRPGAFFKGVLLPLCESQDCTLKEATIIGSVLSKVSIPMMHSAAAMLRMAAMPYSGATSLFLRVLLNKKYSLPYKAIDSLVKHFVQFRNETRELPVLWHQALLVFAQRYKATLTEEQKEFMKPLLKQHFHHQITPEIRRELFYSVSRS